MIWLIVIPLLIVVLTAVVSAIVFYVQFCNSPEKQWRQEVLDLTDRARRRAQTETESLEHLGTEHAGDIRRLTEERFVSYLTTVSVNELESYAGIGHGTIAKLVSAGYVDLATLRHARLDIHGLGDKRLTDIDTAVRDLLRKAQLNFDQLTCSPAQALVADKEALSRRYAGLAAQVKTRVHAAQQICKQLQKSESIAYQVTFWSWLRPNPNDQLVLQQLLGSDLPDLDATIRAAQQNLVQPGQAKREKIPASRHEVNVAPVNSITDPKTVVRSKPDTRRDLAQESLDTENKHSITMELIIKFAMAVARADGPVTSTEQKLIEQHLRQHYPYNRAMQNRVESLCAHYQIAAIDFESCCGQINREFTAAHRTALFDLAIEIASASGTAGHSATQFLKSVEQHLGVRPSRLSRFEHSKPPNSVESLPIGSSMTDTSSAPSRVAATKSAVEAQSPTLTAALSENRQLLKAKSSAIAGQSADSPSQVSPIAAATKPNQSRSLSEKECLNLLEIPSGTPISADLIRRQFNLLSQRFASEKLASLGADFVKLAELKFTDVRRAAEIVLLGLGEKLEIKPIEAAAQELRSNTDLDDVFGR
jgi:uncharacterized tellurite resistance protein B-like protein